MLEKILLVCVWWTLFPQSKPFVSFLYEEKNALGRRTNCCVKVHDAICTNSLLLSLLYCVKGLLFLPLLPSFFLFLRFFRPEKERKKDEAEKSAWVSAIESPSSLRLSRDSGRGEQEGREEEEERGRVGGEGGLVFPSLSLSLALEDERSKKG